MTTPVRLHPCGWIKVEAADFLVREIPRLGNDTQKGNTLLLTKCGYSTMYAIERLADALAVDATTITYGGLKDEDAISEQLLGVRCTISPQTLRAFNHAHNGTKAFLRVTPVHSLSPPTRPGDILGNAFGITVRGLSKATAVLLASLHRRPFCFLNYYDVQRFGLPGKPMRAHLMGRCINEGDLARLGELLVESGNRTLEEVQNLATEAGGYLKAISPTEACFFLNAWESWQWNLRLAECVETKCSRGIHVADGPGFAFKFWRSERRALSLLHCQPELPHLSIRLGSTLRKEWRKRATVVQTIVSGRDCCPDTIKDGWQATLDFFLPSGSYATMAIKQLLLAMAD